MPISKFGVPGRLPINSLLLKLANLLFILFCNFMIQSTRFYLDINFVQISRNLKFPINFDTPN